MNALVSGIDRALVLTLCDQLAACQDQITVSTFGGTHNWHACTRLEFPCDERHSLELHSPRMVEPGAQVIVDEVSNQGL
jgi:hypothetical protein